MSCYTGFCVHAGDVLSPAVPSRVLYHTYVFGHILRKLALLFYKQLQSCFRAWGSQAAHTQELVLFFRVIVFVKLLVIGK